MTKEEQRDLLLQKLAQHACDGRFAGLTAEQAALAMGATPELACSVAAAWTGSAVLR